MKKILFLFLLTECANFQTVTFTEEEYQSQVFEDLGGTQDELFTKANAWLVNLFKDKDAESVIQHSDKDQGVIMGKYLIHGSNYIDATGSTYDDRKYAVIDIRLKDNKARIEIKPQGSWVYDANEREDRRLSKVQAIIDMKELTKSFHQALLAKEREF